jgi:hypothetical protein
MANRDIAGLLTGIPSGGIDPMAKLTPQQMRAQIVSGAQQRMGSALRGMFNGGPTIQEKIVQAAGEKQRADEAKRLKQLENLANALPDEYASLKNAVENGVEGAVKKAVEILGREKKAPTKVDKKIVNLVNTKTDKTMGTAVEVDGQLFNSQGQLMSPQELEGLGVSASYVKPPTPLVSTAVNPALKAKAERRSQLFTPLEKIAESTAVSAESAGNEKRNAQTALRAVDTNAKTGAISAVSSDLAQIGQDVFQNLGIQVPANWSKSTSSKAQYQMISAQGLLPRIEEQGRGFTDTEREYFLKEVIPSYKQAWQFNELSSSLQLEGATLKIAEAGFANNRRAWHVTEDKTPSQAHSVVWDDYTTKLPYSKLRKNAKRMIGDKEVTYDKYHIMPDDGKLWQYWSSGQEPTGFTLRQADGTTKDYSFAELNNLFSGFSAREVLQQADKTGHLVGATY